MQEMNKISHKNIAIADADSLFILKEDTKMFFFDYLLFSRKNCSSILLQILIIVGVISKKK